MLVRVDLMVLDFELAADGTASVIEGPFSVTETAIPPQLVTAVPDRPGWHRVVLSGYVEIAAALAAASSFGFDIPGWPGYSLLRLQTMVPLESGPPRHSRRPRDDLQAIHLWVARQAASIARADCVVAELDKPGYGKVGADAPTNLGRVTTVMMALQR